MKSSRSGGMSTIPFWQVHPASSLVMEGEKILWASGNWLPAGPCWFSEDGAYFPDAGRRGETSKDRKVICRLFTHLGQPQLHVHCGLLSGHRHMKEVIVGVNNKCTLKKEMNTTVARREIL